MRERLLNQRKSNVATFQIALHNHNRRHARINVGTRPREVRKSTRKIRPVSQSHWCSDSFNGKTATQRGGAQHRHSPESTTPSPSTTCARKCGASRSTKTDPQDSSSVTWVGDNLNDKNASQRGRAQHHHFTKSSKHPPRTTYTRECRRAASRSTKTDPQDTSIVR